MNKLLITGLLALSCKCFAGFEAPGVQKKPFEVAPKVTSTSGTSSYSSTSSYSPYGGTSGSSFEFDPSEDESYEQGH